MEREEKKTVEIEAMGVILLILIVALWPVVVSNIQASSVFGNISVYLYQAALVGKKILGILTGISLPLSLFFIIVIIYTTEGLKLIRKKEELIYDTKTEMAYEPTGEAGDAALAHRWEAVTKHIASESASDWKQAIMEADIILDDILTKMGYQGESVGEKLKRVDPGDMKMLDEAWAAHRVRNQIAHEGSGFSLNQIEAQRVIAQYRKVFEEFFYV